MRIPVEVPQRKIENGPAGKRPAKIRNIKPGSVGAKFIYSEREGGNQQDADPQVMEDMHLEKEPEFSPEEMKAIEDTAHFIQEHRMSNDPERQQYWAKKYGLDENIFSEKNIKAILSGRGEWNDASEKFMQDWDWKTAKKAFMNMKKADEQASKPKMEDAVRRKAKENQGQINRKSAEDKRIEDLEDDQLKRNMEFDAEQEQPAYGYKQGDEALAFSRDWKEKKYENVKPVEISSENQKLELDPNDPNQAELNKAIRDFDIHRRFVEDERAKKTGRFTSLWKTLGRETGNLENDEGIKDLEKESHRLYRSYMAKGINLYKGDKPQLENFLREFGDQNKIFSETYNREMEKRAGMCGWPENVLAGFHRIGKKWSELKPWQKIVIGAGGGLLTAGGALALGAGTFGALALGAGYRWGFRGFGAMAMGIGRKIKLQKENKEARDKEGEAEVNKMMETLEQHENDIDAGIEVVINEGKNLTNVRKNYEETSLENTRQALKLTGKTFIISIIIGEGLRLGSQYTGINIGSILSKIGEKTGISLAGMKESFGNFLSVSQANAEGGGMTGGSGGGVHGAYPEGKYGPAGYWSEQEGHNVVAAYPEGKYGPLGHGTEGEGHVNEFDEKYGPGKTGTEQEGHNVVAAYPEGKYGPLGHGTEGENHVNEFDDKYGPGKTGTEQEGHNVVAAYPEGKYGPLGHGTEGEGYKDIPKSTNERYGHGKYGPLGNATEADGHNLVDSHPEGKYGPLGHGTEQTGHIADMREVASGKFGSGGSIERASNNILRAIKANPAQYGLDSHDPNFSEHANNLREKMIEEFYTKKGFDSYNDFDAYARSHVQPKDMFKIDYDPEAGKFHMSYEGKAFGPDVSGGGAAQEISHLEGGELKPEEAVKPRTGAAHHPARGAGRAMHYEGDTPDQKIAKEDFAKASDYQKAVREFNAKEAVRLEAVNEVANSRLFTSMRGLLNQLVNGAGVGNKGNFWQHSMDDWGKLLGSENYVAQDIRLTDEARVVSFDKLKGLYPILERYHRLGFETIGECLKEAVKDPKILRLIDVAVLKK